MLGDHAADASGAMDRACADRDGGGHDDTTDLPGSGAAADQRERHITLRSRVFSILPSIFVASRRTLSRVCLIQFFISVVLPGNAWPLKIALERGAVPLWFAEDRAVLSGLTAGLLLAPLHWFTPLRWFASNGRLRLPKRADLSAIIAVGALQLGVYFVLAHLAIVFGPAGRPVQSQ
jgi:hypothetical protein